MAPGVWVRWRMGGLWSRAHFAEGLDSRDVGVAAYPMTCGAHTPDWLGVGDVVVVDSLDAVCKNCLRIREEERNRNDG